LIGNGDGDDGGGDRDGTVPRDAVLKDHYFERETGATRDEIEDIYMKELQWEACQYLQNV
jgi:hypothetical protein